MTLRADSQDFLASSTHSNSSKSAFNKAMTASVIFHVGILTTLYFTTLHLGAPVIESEQGNYLQISLLKTSKPQAPPISEQELETRVEAEHAVEEELADESRATAQVQESQQAQASDNNGDEGLDIESEQESLGFSPSINTADINNMLSTYSRSYRSELIGTFIDECARYKNEHGVNECPEDEHILPGNKERESVAALFDTWVSGHDSNKREADRLLDEMEFLRPMLKELGPRGDLVRDRYAFAASAYMYLGPDAKEGDVVPIVTFSGDKLVFLSGLVVFSFGGRFSFNDETLQAPALQYRRAMFSAEKPEAQEDDTSFILQAPLFRSAR